MELDSVQALDIYFQGSERCCCVMREGCKGETSESARTPEDTFCRLEISYSLMGSVKVRRAS